MILLGTCAVTLVVGGALAWYIIAQGGPEALGAIMPMLFVGAVHLFAAPAAVLRACQSRQPKVLWSVLAYFALYLAIAIAAVGPEAIFYYVAFVAFVRVPLAGWIVVTLVREW